MKLRSGALGGLAAIVALVLTAIVYNLLPVRGSDHQDSPTVLARPAADITDMFLYPSPSNPQNVVLQMDVDPLLAPGGPTTTAALDPQVLYQFKIAHGTAAGAEDMVIQLMASGAGTTQTINVYGPFKPPSTGVLNTVGTLTGTIPFNGPAGRTLSNGLKVFVGPRSDPFFFDLFAFFKFLPDRDAKTPGTTAPAGTPLSFNFTPAQIAASPIYANCLAGTPTDALSSNNFNVLSIVVEAPRSLIAPSTGSSVVHLWGTTSTTTGS